MENDEVEKTSAVRTIDDVDSRSAVNATILDYYKKFGRKRDLEQFFSLSTAEGEIKDTSGLFWRKMKSENDSSDSGGRKSESSHEVCRISIRCSLPDPSSSQDDEEQQTKTDSPHTESPPIITEEVPADISMRHTDDESINFDDNNSQKSLDALLDLSAHKPLSPTSSITSQRKLEWDSLADVGYANESDRKNSASSLSTLERLALKQQYSNNDSKQDIGAPTSHSTPLDENDNKSKSKKGLGKKSTKIYKKDVDFVEVNVPHTSDTNQAPSINVNLTKHISFNVERDGGVTIDNVKQDVSISPEKVTVETNPYLGMDKEVQTSLTKDIKDKSSIEKSNTVDELPKPVNPYNQKIPVMISLNTLRKRLRRRKTRQVRRKLRPKKQIAKQNVTPQEKSGEQLSEAESFEYMPGHMYHQNQMNENEPRPDNSTAGNKSSLESSGPFTTDSSKGSNHSLTKDLEKCVDLLKVTLQKRYDDGSTKKKLIKDIVRRLISSKYRDDETTTEFLSGLTFDSKKLGTKENTTTSTSDANNTEDSADKKPKKSILRHDKFNSNVVASTSQSAPNLFSASSEKLNSNLMKTIASLTDSDVSSRGKTSSENAFPKTSSEELYLKYLEALRREEAYKRHLKDKEMFLKQKLVSSETAFKVPVPQEAKISNRLKDLMKDLTRNNYDDGSGDASKLEGGSSSNMNLERFSTMRNQRSHSVFTLSSSHSEGQKRPNLKKKMQVERDIGEAGPSKSHYCCCPHHYLNPKMHCVDSSVQVSIKQIEEAATKDEPCQTKKQVCAAIKCECEKCRLPLSPGKTRVVPDRKTGEIKYVCLCHKNQVSSSDVGDNFMIYKCCKLTNRGVQLEDPARLGNTGIQCGSSCNSVKDDKIETIQPPCQMQTGTESSCSDDTSKQAKRRHSKSSQTNMIVNMCFGSNNYCSSSSDAKILCGTSTKCIVPIKYSEKCVTVREATRCLQTEISINPKISDPTLSDINIIDNYNCAKLISECLRKVSIPSSNSEGGKSFSDVCTNSTSEKIIIESLGSDKKEDKTQECEEEKGTSGESSKVFDKDYTIPIKGTNMTLTVNLTGTGNNKKIEQTSECVVTDKISVADEATSAIEENKSTQCSGKLFIDHSKICIIERSVSKKSSMSKKHVTDSSINCNTLPKICPPKEKPPFKRTNTDTGKLSICTCIQTDSIKTKDVETNNNQSDIESKETSEKQCDSKDLKTKCDKKTDGMESNKNYKDRETDCTENNKNYKDRETDSTESNKSDKCKKTDTIKSNEICFCNKNIKISIGVQKDLCEEDAKITCKKPVKCGTDVGVETEIDRNTDKGVQTDIQKEENNEDVKKCPPKNKPNDTPTRQETCCYKVCIPGSSKKSPVIDMIKDITRCYSKTEMIKIKKNKCFSEIITVLNYLLETEDSTDPDQKICSSTNTDTKSSNDQTKRNKTSDEYSDKCVDKSVQPSCKKSCKGNKVGTESSELPCSSDLPTTSSDSAACRVLNKIKKECEKYHQKVKCRGRKCEVSSSTSVNCEKCKKIHHCACRSHKCKRSKAFEKLQKKCIAYNLIIQTSESMLSEEAVCEKKGRTLKNIIVKVPKRKGDGKKSPCREQGSGRSSPSPRCSKNRSRSCPDECETSDDYTRRIELATVREYLEQNRPDFVEKTSQRQNCLKFISERRTQGRCPPSLKMVVVHKPTCTGNVASVPVYCGGMCYKRCDSVEPCQPCDKDPCNSCRSYNPCEQNPCVPCNDPCNPCFDPCTRANERAAQRDLLSLHVEQQPDLTNLSSDELRLLAKQIGLDLRKKKPSPKFMSEREMKKHSERIYKTLPEVVQKKEEKRKENIKKTNLLMANMFKKNLQKQALKGSVNLSNYNSVIKI
ncbi:hypothetical protein PYW08_008039 [Mythimna loreyi]|uniref:Uncharacterized protein n=1 Tax=Mythimna loreyi TaxID=667449 RepID=A0ACC2QC66_9NEOP|nr:hypothetical protein PYW08_008039 [Mythimna loreyi]